MIIDANLLLDTAAAVPVAFGGTQASTNIIDLLNARDIGEGDMTGATPKILCLVTSAFLSAGASTLQVFAQGSTDNVTWTTYAETPAIPKATLTAGTMIARFSWPAVLPESGALPRYLRLVYGVAVATFTQSGITAAIVLSRDDSGYYPPGVVVAN